MMFTSIPFRDPSYLRRVISRRIPQIILTWQTQRGRHNVADKLPRYEGPGSCLRSVVTLSAFQTGGLRNVGLVVEWLATSQRGR